jgi:hypothetical protein
VIYAWVSAKRSPDGNFDRQRNRLLDEAQKRDHDPVLVVTEQASALMTSDPVSNACCD